MAEGFEPYHVPQQSRRDKLRVVAQNHPLFDPSLLFSSSSSSDLHHNPPSLPKDEAPGSTLMAFASSSNYNPYLDPPNLPNLASTSSIHDIHSNFMLYSQNLKALGSSFNGGSEPDVVIPLRPETLSLSLSSQSQPQCNLPLELNLQRYGSAVSAAGGYGVSGENAAARSAVPLGPFTGYASILKGSRFLKPAQQLLEEICDVGRDFYGDKLAMDASFFDPSVDCFNADDPASSAGDGSQSRRDKSKLISMLDEVYRRYRYYYQQMQAVMASFECVAGLGNAAPYAHLAMKALSKHFKSLKNAITDQLQFSNKGHHGKEEATRFGNHDKAPYFQSSGHNSGFNHQPIWRPQRGLPERAVAVLKAWLFEHFLHPYPNDSDKLMLARQTGLSRSQVSNWFINARVRLWKPMVEEIHMLETRQAQKGSQRLEQNTDSSTSLAASNSVGSENPTLSAHGAYNIPSKRTRSGLPDFPSGNEEPMNLSYNSLAGRSNGVSLTLGLHQNNGISVSEPFPLNVAQRFGLGHETSGELVMGGFEAPNRHFGGKLLHDFVG